MAYDAIGVTARINAWQHSEADAFWGRKWVCQCASCRLVRQKAKAGVAEYVRTADKARKALANHGR